MLTSGRNLGPDDLRGRAWGLLTAALIVLGLLARAGGASWLQVLIFVAGMSAAAAALIFRKSWFGNNTQGRGPGKE